MPITQERFMNVIAGAKHVIALNDAVQQALEKNLAYVMTDANTAMIHTQDAGAQLAIRALVNHINHVRNIFVEQVDSDTKELQAIILAEEIHFLKSRKKNNRAATHQRIARMERGAIPRQQVALKRTATVDPRGPSVHITEPKLDVEQTPEYKRITEEIRNKYWPDASPQGSNSEPPVGRARQGPNGNPDGNEVTIHTYDDTTGLTQSFNIPEQTAKAFVKQTSPAPAQVLSTRKTLPIEEVIAQEQAENEAIFGPLDLDERCRREIEIQKRQHNSAEAVRQGGASYVPGVLRTSVPPASEMLEADITEGKDVL